MCKAVSKQHSPCSLQKVSQKPHFHCLLGYEQQGGVGLAKQILHAPANTGSRYLKGRDEHCSDDIWISLWFLLDGCLAHCRAGKLVWDGRGAFCSREEPGYSWSKTGWERVHQAAGGCSEGDALGAAEEEVAPVRLSEAVTAKKRRKKKCREKKKERRKKTENRKGVEYENKARAPFVPTLFGKEGQWGSKRAAGGWAWVGRPWWAGSHSRSSRCGDLPCASPGSCRAGSTRQPRFTEQRGKSKESSQGGRSTKGGVRLWSNEQGGRPPVPAWPWLFPRAHRKATTLVTQGLQRCSVRGASSVEKDGAVYVIYSEIRWFIIMNNEFLHVNWSSSTNLRLPKSSVPLSPHMPFPSVALSAPSFTFTIYAAQGAGSWGQPAVPSAREQPTRRCARPPSCLVHPSCLLHLFCKACKHPSSFLLQF